MCILWAGFVFVRVSVAFYYFLFHLVAPISALDSDSSTNQRIINLINNIIINNNAFNLYVQLITDQLSIFSFLFAEYILFKGTMVSVALSVDLFLMQFIDSQYVIK